jgi:molybdenum cofactor synthesis domain-containing protein
MAGDANVVVVVTVSDRCGRGEAVDTSGPALVEYCASELGMRAEGGGCVADESDAIEKLLREHVSRGVALVLTTGGTGLGPRDNTPEAAMRVIERPHPQLLELARARCLATAPRAYLSRGVSGSAGRTLIVTLPGSERGAVETLAAIVDVLPHALAMIAGGDHAEQ